MRTPCCCSRSGRLQRQHTRIRYTTILVLTRLWTEDSGHAGVGHTTTAGWGAKPTCRIAQQSLSCHTVLTVNCDGTDEVVHLLLCRVRTEHPVEGEADIAGVLCLGDTDVDGVSVDADACLTTALRVLQRVQGPRSQHDLDTTVAIKRACSNIIIDIATTGRVTELSFPARRRCLGIFGTTEPAAGRQAGTPAHTSRCYVLSGIDGAPAPAAAGDSAPVAAAAGFLGVLVAVFPDGLGGMTAHARHTGRKQRRHRQYNVQCYCNATAWRLWYGHCARQRRTREAERRAAPQGRINGSICGTHQRFQNRETDKFCGDVIPCAQCVGWCVTPGGLQPCQCTVPRCVCARLRDRAAWARVSGGGQGIGTQCSSTVMITVTTTSSQLLISPVLIATIIKQPSSPSPSHSYSRVGMSALWPFKLGRYGAVVGADYVTVTQNQY